MSLISKGTLMQSQSCVIEQRFGRQLQRSRHLRWKDVTIFIDLSEKHPSQAIPFGLILDVYPLCRTTVHNRAVVNRSEEEAGILV